MMFIKKMRIYSFWGMNLGGVTFLFCYLYTEHLMQYLNVKLVMGIIAVIAAIQGLLASLIYRNIKNHFPSDQLNNQERIE